MERKKKEKPQNAGRNLSANWRLTCSMISGSAVRPDLTKLMISSQRMACASSFTSAKLLFHTVDLLSFHALLLLKGSTTGIELRLPTLKLLVKNFVETLMAADTIPVKVPLLSLQPESLPDFPRDFRGLTSFEFSNRIIF